MWQIFSLLLRRPLETVNCHQHTETADFLGNLRPIRNREAVAQQLQAEIAHFTSRLDVSVLPASLHWLVDDTDRAELCSGDVTRAMAAIDRVVKAIEQRTAERLSAGEETKKPQAAHQPERGSHKRKKHRPHLLPPPAVEESVGVCSSRHGCCRPLRCGLCSAQRCAVVGSGSAISARAVSVTCSSGMTARWCPPCGALTCC